MQSTVSPFPSRCWPWLALLLGLPMAAAAQPTITGLSPTRNQRSAPRTANVTQSFSQTISAGTAANVRVFSQQRGGQLNRPGGGTLSGGGTNTLTFDPADNFRPGETVFVTVPGSVQSTGGQAVAKQAYQFTAAAAGTGRGGVSNIANYGVGIKPRGVTAADIDNDGDLDLLTANEAVNTVSILRNNGAGGFGANTEIAVGDSPENVAPTDVDGDGDLDLLVANGWSNSVSVLLNNGTGTFTSSPTVSVGDTPWMVASADVDADGDMDLLTANLRSNDVSIRLNNGSGTFSGGSTIAVGDAPWGIAVGDIDADGDMDLLTANMSGNSVGVRFNNGAGVFSGTTDLSIGTFPTSVNLSDMDGDGDLDLLTANNGGNDISIRLNNGTGTFSGGSQQPAGDGPATVATGDLDADGDLDLVVTNFAGSTMRVSFNLGGGAYGNGFSMPTGAGPWGLVVADLDGDGDLDLASCSYNNDQTVSLRFNIAAAPTLTALSASSALVGATVTLTGTTFAENSTVTFNGTPATSVTYNSPTSLTAVVPAGPTNGVVTVTTADGTSNGLPFTIVTTMFVTGTTPVRNALSVAPATNIGLTFSAPVSAATADNARVFSSQRGGQLVRGGNATVSGNTLTVNPAQDLRPGETVAVTVPASVQNTNGVAATPLTFRFTAGVSSTGSGRFDGGGDYPAGSRPRTVTAADIDGDGDLDMLTSNTQSGTVTVARNNGAGSFFGTSTVSVGNSPNDVATADVDGDGDLDLLVANSDGNNVSVRTNNGSGSFSGSANFSVGGSPWVVLAADVDADGDLDMLTANRTGNSVSIVLNNGAGVFTGGSSVAVGVGPWGLAVGDVDNDGDLDLITANQGQGQTLGTTASVRLNNGAGVFSGGSEVSVGFGPSGAALADVDGDGDLDMLTANFYGNSVSVRVNNGTGTFSGGTDVGTGSGTASVAATDVDGDGDLDITAVNFSGNSVSVRRNNGAGAFSGNTEVPVGGGPWGVAMADVDNDGDLDIATANFNGGNSISIRLNQPPLTGTVTISSSAGSPTGVTPIPVQVLFNDRVTGFVATDVVVGNGTVTGGSFSGSGRLYNFTVTPAAPGTVTVDVPANVAVDSVGAGNKAAPSFSITFTVVTVTGLTSDEPTPAGTATVHYAVTFSAPVTGVSSSNFNLTTTGLTGASISGVTGSGSTYYVTVNTGSGNGTLRVDLTNTTGISPTVTTATITGPTYTITKTFLNPVLTIQGTGGTGSDVTAFVDAVELIMASNNAVVSGGVTNGSFETHDPLTNGDYGYNPTGASWGFSGQSGIAENGSAFVPPTTPNGSAVAFVQNTSQIQQTLTPAAGSLRIRFQAGQRNCCSTFDQALNVLIDGVYLGRILPPNDFGYSAFVSDPFSFNLVDLTVSTPQTVPGGTYRTITVTRTGEATLDGDITVTGALVVQTGGLLDDGCHVITGTGSVTVQAGATFNICAPSGLNSTSTTLGPNAVQVTGARSYSDDATYAFTAGFSAQLTGDEFPATVRELRIRAFQLEQTNAALAIRQRLGLEDLNSARPALRGGPNGFFVNGNRTLTLLSTAAGTAYVANAPGREVFGTNVHVQRYIPGPVAASYHHLASPVQSTTVADLATTGFTPKVNVAYNPLPTPTLSGANFPNVFGYDEARGGTTPAFQDFTNGYYSPAALTTTLTSGRGYTVAIPSGKTPDFVGTLTTGPVDVALSHTGVNTGSNKAGWHLLGNPYPQPIDWDLLTTPANLDAAVYVWTSTGGNNGIYRTRNASGVGSLTNGIIGIGQGFFVRNTASTIFPFRDNLRVEGAYATPLGRTALPTASRLTLTLAQVGAPADQTDEVTVYAEAGATTGFDGAFDATRPGRNVGVPTLSALIDGEEAMISALPAATLTTGTTVELLLALPTAGTYALNAATLLNLPGVALLDRATNTTYDLAQQPTARFTAPAGEMRGRFALVFGGQRVLGTAANAAATRFTLWPNPARSSVRLEGATAESATLLDATGRIVRVWAVTPAATDLPLTGLAPGVYSVRVGAATRRLVIE